MIFDLKRDKTVNETYKLMAQTIIPRPIAWIVTEESGVINIAPFSYFIGLSSDPASVLVSIGHKPDGTPKDTLRNLRKTKKCTICMVEEKDLVKMHFSSKSLENGMSEAEQFDIDTHALLDNFPPMIKGAPVSYFCEFNQEIALGGLTVPVVLNVNQIYIDDKNITNKERLTIDFEPLARIGKSYAVLGKKIEAPDIP